MMTATGMDGMGLEKPYTVFKNPKQALKKRTYYPYVHVSPEFFDLMGMGSDSDGDSMDEGVNLTLIENFVRSILINEEFKNTGVLDAQGQQNQAYYNTVTQKLKTLLLFKTPQQEYSMKDKADSLTPDYSTSNFKEVADTLNTGLENIRYDVSPPEKFKTAVKKGLRLDDPKEKGGLYLKLKSLYNTIVKAQKDKNLVQMGNDIEIDPVGQDEEKDHVKNALAKTAFTESVIKFDKINFETSKNQFFELIPENVKKTGNQFTMQDMVGNTVVLEWLDNDYKVLNIYNKDSEKRLLEAIQKNIGVEKVKVSHITKNDTKNFAEYNKYMR